MNTLNDSLPSHRFTMKSIIKEARTVAKAIDAALTEAGYPKECTIKILEQPEYNFFGFTTRSAKIALIFSHDTRNNKRSEDTRDTRAPRQEKPAKNNTAKKDAQAPASDIKGPKKQDNAPAAKRVKEENIDTRPEKNQAKIAEKADNGSAWEKSDVLAQTKRELSELLKRLYNSEVPAYGITTDGNTLTVAFNTLLSSSEEIVPEKHMRSALAMILLSILRMKYKRVLKTARIIITSPDNA